MLYSPVTLAHIAAGMTGVAAGFTALAVRKGSRVHRRAGDVFVVAMLAMAASGAIAALVKWQPVNILAGLSTLYLVTTAWLTVRRRPGQAGRSEFALMLFGLATTAVAFGFAWKAAHGGTGSTTSDSPTTYAVFAALTLVLCVGDARLLARGGLSGASRLVRHLGRMGFALVIAAGSFFLGRAGDPVMRRVGLRAVLFPPEVRRTHLPEIPVLIVVALTLFWLVRVQTSRRYRKPDPDA